MPRLRRSDSASFLSERRRMQLQRSELRLLLLWKPLCLSFPIRVSSFFPVYETHWPPALLGSVPPLPPQKPTLYIGGGEQMLRARRPRSVHQPPGGSAGAARTDGPPAGPASPPGPWSSGPAETRALSALPSDALLCKTRVLADKRWWPDRAQLLPAAERWGGEGGPDPGAWSKTGREPTPSPFPRECQDQEAGRSPRGPAHPCHLKLASSNQSIFIERLLCAWGQSRSLRGCSE